MELSQGWFLNTIIIIVFCIVCPALLIAYDEAPVSEPLWFRIAFLRWSAWLSGMPLLAIFFWDHLGIPPSHFSLVVWSLFCVAMATSPLSIAFRHFVRTAGHFGMVFAAVGFLLLTFVQPLIPPLLTLRDIHSEPALPVPPNVEMFQCGDRTVTPLFAHISDLHISDQAKTRDRKHPGNHKLPAIITQINLLKPPFLIISGDITDEGTAAQWRTVESFLSTLDPGIRIIATTGNHDLNFFFGNDPAEELALWAPNNARPTLDEEPRIFRAAEVQASFFPELRTNSGLFLREIIDEIPNQSNKEKFTRQINECQLDCSINGGGFNDPKLDQAAAAGCRSLCPTNLGSIRFHYFHDFVDSFPLVYVDQDLHSAFISMTTSLAGTAAVGRNGIGWIGTDQIRNFRAELTDLPPDTKYIVIVMHHSPLWFGVPAPPLIAFRDFLHPMATWDSVYSSQWFTAVFLHNDFRQANEIYEILKEELAKRPAASALIAYGHRHERSLRHVGRVTLEEAPNLAAEKPQDYGFYLTGVKSDALAVSWCSVDEPPYPVLQSERRKASGR